MTRFAKTRHNGASLNLQIEMGTILVYFTVINACFLMKKGSNGKNLDIILLPILENLCFGAVGLRICELWPFVYVRQRIVHN